jgi:hypothetical protein
MNPLVARAHLIDVMPRPMRTATFPAPRASVLRCACLVAALASCTTELDPSVLPLDGGQMLATCSSFVELPPAEYVICPEPMNFEAAAADCVRRGATLAAVGSTQENEYIAVSASSLVNGNLWLGGTRDDAHVWRWPNGSVFWRGGPDGAAEGDAFVTWLRGEPNDSSTVTTDPERCLALTFTANNWNDRACSLRLPYVCELATPGL